MSVVRGETARRWSLVAGGVAVLLALPTAGPALRDRVMSVAVPPTTAADAVRQALAADTVAYSGLAESRGGTSLPDLPRLADVTAILGGTTRTRVWWAGPERWRVDTVDATGEQDLYADAGALVVWDYEGNNLTTVFGAARVRFPRSDDLLPPLAARRVLRGLGPDDEVRLLPGARWVAGRQTRGLRVVPQDPHATVAAVDVWTDVRTHLPLAVTVRGPAGVVALDSTFVTVDLAAPPARVLAPPAAPAADRDFTTEGDLVQQIDRFARLPLPSRVAGVDRSDSLVGGVATYGDGLARFVALPLRRGLGNDVVRAAVAKGAEPLKVSGGSAYLLRSGVLTVVVARDGDGDRVYLLSGLVDAELLRRAAQDVLTTRTGRRPG